MNRYQHLIKILIWIPVIIMAFGIFGFSSQDGEESGGLSRKVSVLVIESIDHIPTIHMNPDQKEQYTKAIEYPIRKCAHMTEYAILCSFIYLAFTIDGISKIKSRFLALCGAVVFACTDEIHQLYVPDRSGRFTDVLVDTAGCIIGLFICYLITKIRNHMKIKRKSTNIM